MGSSIEARFQTDVAAVRLNAGIIALFVAIGFVRSISHFFEPSNPALATPAMAASGGASQSTAPVIAETEPEMPYAQAQTRRMDGGKFEVKIPAHATNDE